MIKAFGGFEAKTTISRTAFPVTPAAMSSMHGYHQVRSISRIQGSQSCSGWPLVIDPPKSDMLPRMKDPNEPVTTQKGDDGSCRM